MSSLADKRFLFVTGKGGVGKTTVCAAAAVALAGRGKRVLVAMCNAKERLSTMLGSEPIGNAVQPVAPNVWAVNMDPERALDEYGRLVLHSKTLASLLFDNKIARTFFRAIPGMAEWTMLGKAWWHTTETRADGSLAYDVVIVDGPATGHGLDMLRVPKVIVEIAPTGLLRRDADRAYRFFQNADATAIVLVTVPEEMPTSETIELARALEGELALPVGRIIVNAMLPPLFSKDERRGLETLPAVGDDTALGSVLAAGRDRATRERVQAEAIGRLGSELGRPTSYLPLLFEEAAEPAAIHELAKRIL
jgi:anion-transporting  ArsA/GET3 family ATPase